jgi:hypothetical protein
LLHLVHRQILKINEMNAISLRVHLAELHDVGGLDTPKNDIHAAVSDRWLAGKILIRRPGRSGRTITIENEGIRSGSYKYRTRMRKAVVIRREYSC